MFRYSSLVVAAMATVFWGATQAAAQAWPTTDGVYLKLKGDRFVPVNPVKYDVQDLPTTKGWHRNRQVAIVDTDDLPCAPIARARDIRSVVIVGAREKLEYLGATSIAGQFMAREIDKAQEAFCKDGSCRTNGRAEIARLLDSDWQSRIVSGYWVNSKTQPRRIDARTVEYNFDGDAFTYENAFRYSRDLPAAMGGKARAVGFSIITNRRVYYVLTDKAVKALRQQTQRSASFKAQTGGRFASARSCH